MVTVPLGLTVVGEESQLHLVSIVCAGPDCAYVGTIVLHDVPPSIEYCRVEPVGQAPAGAEILPPDGVPPKTVHELFTTTAAPGAAVRTGHPGHAPGTVVTELVGLDVAGIPLQLHRVSIVCAGPDWLYAGKIVLHDVPPSVEYCKVDPVGHGAVGAEIEPPEGVPPTTEHVLLVTVTAGATAVNTGHGGQTPGTVVTDPLGLEVVGSSTQLHLVRIVCAGPDWAYVGKVVLHEVPPSVEYCNVDPVGQLPEGAAIDPPDGVPPKTEQVLFVTCTTGAAAVRSGQSCCESAPIAGAVVERV